MPERFQLSRRAGWRMPPNSAKCDRSTRWGNPWVIKYMPTSAEPHSPWAVTNLLLSPANAFFPTEERAAEFAVSEFRQSLLRPFRPGLLIDAVEVRRDLAGRDLGCWCAVDAPWCHADVLLECANC